MTQTYEPDSLLESIPGLDRPGGLFTPEGFSFPDLRCRFGEKGELVIEQTVLEKICRCNGIDLNFVLDGGQPRLMNFVLTCYMNMLARGDQPDDVIEELISRDVRASLLHAPGCKALTLLGFLKLPAVCPTRGVRELVA